MLLIISFVSAMSNTKARPCSSNTATHLLPSDEITTFVPEVNGGYISIPSGPGWGCDLDEEAALRYSYDG